MITNASCQFPIIDEVADIAKRLKEIQAETENGVKLPEKNEEMKNTYPVPTGGYIYEGN